MPETFPLTKSVSDLTTLTKVPYKKSCLSLTGSELNPFEFVIDTYQKNCCFGLFHILKLHLFFSTKLKNQTSLTGFDARVARENEYCTMKTAFDQQDNSDSIKNIIMVLPDSSRLDSSNVDAHLFWQSGCQLGEFQK